MLTKDDLRINESYFFGELRNKFPVVRYVVKKEDEGDPGRICFKNNLPFSAWPLVLRFNDLIDPFVELTAGTIIAIPDKKDLIGF